MKKSNLINYIPLTIGIIVFCLFSFAIYNYLKFDENQKKRNERNKLFDQLIYKKSQLEKSLSSRIYYTKGIAAYVTHHPNIEDKEFRQLASELIGRDSVIATMSLSPDCVISSVYPREGHEEAIGLDLLAHPERRKIVEQTIQTHKTFVAGPVELVEGGIAFISYTPIFEKTQDGENPFWGVTDIVIFRDELFNEAGLNATNNNFEYALRGPDGKGAAGEVFWGNERVFRQDPVTVEITLPTGSWILAITPSGGWKNTVNTTRLMAYVLFGSAVIISILVWLLVRAMLRIRNNQAELKALFGAMSDLVIEFNVNGVYTKIAPTNRKLLVRPPDELLGRSLYDVFPEEQAKFFHDAILKCLETRDTVEIDYPLEIEGKELWFIAKLTRISPDSVIYVARDYTNRKKAEEELIRSQKKLEELNAMKDKFFSIIAHDLKNPLGGYVNLTNMLYDSFDDMNEDEKKEIIELLNDSSKTVYNLLENLLEWSRSQRGKIPHKPENYDISFIADNVISVLALQTEAKNIRINNKIDKSSIAYFDVNSITTVIRNLLSNAIKFTPEGGTITLDANKIEHGGNQFYEVQVSDTGVGMSPEQMNNLFRIDKSVSTKGTNDESGTGLGLILCKEFINKNGGDIKISSIPGEGSTFKFTLPAAENAQ
jgi:PAS domain S-box-containing protein